MSSGTLPGAGNGFLVPGCAIELAAFPEKVGGRCVTNRTASKFPTIPTPDMIFFALHLFDLSI
jgi:hypothetical protein